MCNNKISDIKIGRGGFDNGWLSIHTAFKELGALTTG